MHEFGHSLQSREVGPIYLFKYGIPSLLSAYSDKVHRLNPVEKDANIRAFNWFSMQKGFDCWDANFNPLPENRMPLKVRWWEFFPPVFPVVHIYQAFKVRSELPQK